MPRLNVSNCEDNLLLLLASRRFAKLRHDIAWLCIAVSGMMIRVEGAGLNDVSRKR